MGNGADFGEFHLRLFYLFSKSLPQSFSASGTMFPARRNIFWARVVTLEKIEPVNRCVIQNV